MGCCLVNEHFTTHKPLQSDFSTRELRCLMNKVAKLATGRCLNYCISYFALLHACMWSEAVLTSVIEFLKCYTGCPRLWQDFPAAVGLYACGCWIITNTESLELSSQEGVVGCKGSNAFFIKWFNQSITLI